MNPRPDSDPQSQGQAPGDDAGPTIRTRPGLVARLRNYFFAGVLVTAPISITLWLTWKLVSSVDSLVKPLIPPEWNLLPETIGLPGLGLVIAVVCLVLIGMFTAGYLGRIIHRTGEMVLVRVPVVRSIYNATKQILETVLAERSEAFRDAVLIEYPCRGTWAVGFLTGRTIGEVQEKTNATVLNIFVPATPNATTGFLLFIPEDEVRYPDVNVEEGIKLVISGGLVTPSKSKRERAAGIAEREPRRPDKPKKFGRFSLMARLRNYFLAGILVTAPAAITIWLAWEFISFVDGRVKPQIPPEWNPETYLPFGIPGLGLLVIFAGLTLIGMLTAGFLGRLMMRSGERFVGRLPVIRSIYGATKQIFETVLAQSSNAFRQVVLIQFPRPGSWAIGFLTGDTAAQIQDMTPSDNVNVFLPTTPNPTSGFLLFVPRNEVQILRMSVEDGLKMVVSGGIVTPTNGETPKGEAPGPSAGDPSPDRAPPLEPVAQGD